MDDMFMIYLDDYIRHIDDKLTLYAMLRRLEEDIGKLPECDSTAALRSRMEGYAPRLDEMWEGWNIPLRYLISGELDDLSDLMDEELMEPEDAGYFCAESYAISEDEDEVPTTARFSLEFLTSLVDLANQLYSVYANLLRLTRRQIDLRVV